MAKVSRFTTREECRGGLQNLGLVEARIAKFTAASEERIRKFEEAERTRLGELAGPLLKEQTELVADLFLYYKENQKEIEKDGRHSIEFPGVGVLARKESSSLTTLKAVSWGEVVKRLQAAGHKELLRFPDPEPKKPEIKNAGLTAEELEAYGMKIVPASLKKQWGYTIYETAAADAATGAA